MEEKFDYSLAMSELEEIRKKVEDPRTSLDDIGALVSRSKELIKQCRDYLRSVREAIDKSAEQDDEENPF
ncbi:MAG: exodeoxyribonuclease VII small subunit [Bacteroidales bacterium]|nr:exodeoxyribonuclease VII small subunit [Bacteroidales bacterium]